MDDTSNNFLKIFNDFEENTSSMNFVWSVSIIVIVSVWIILSIMAGELQHVSGGDALWFSSLFGGKVLQSFFELKNPVVTKKRSMLLRSIWIFAVLGIVFTWGFLSIQSASIQHFTSGDAAWFTALFASKVGQTYVERTSAS